MTPIAVAVKHMLAAGMDAGAVVAAVWEMEQALPVSDAAADRRRAWDRERKRRKRAMSTGIPPDSAEFHLSPSPPDKGPPDPLKLTPNPLPFSDPKGSSFPTKSQFEEFWLAYPRKVGKGAARPKYAIACRKLADHGEAEPAARLLEALNRAKGMWKDPQFIPHPATWLNGERWDDETEPVKGFRLTDYSQPQPRPADWSERMAKLRKELGTDGPEDANSETTADRPAGLLGSHGASDLSGFRR